MLRGLLLRSLWGNEKLLLMRLPWPEPERDSSAHEQTAFVLMISAGSRCERRRLQDCCGQQSRALPRAAGRPGRRAALFACQPSGFQPLPGPAPERAELPLGLGAEGPTASAQLQALSFPRWWRGSWKVQNCAPLPLPARILLLAMQIKLHLEKLMTKKKEMVDKWDQHWEWLQQSESACPAPLPSGSGQGESRAVGPPEEQQLGGRQ